MAATEAVTATAAVGIVGIAAATVPPARVVVAGRAGSGISKQRLRLDR